MADTAAIAGPRPGRLGARLCAGLAATLLGLSACASLAPALPAAAPGIAAQWPLPARTTNGGASADIGWRDFFRDPGLAELIGRALAHNRDLRVAVLNVERARSLYRVQRASLLPAATATAALNHGSGNAFGAQQVDTVALGVTFELDLFGRVRSASAAALQQFFAQEEGRRSAQLSLVAEVARAYLTLAADQESQRVALATLANQQAAYLLIARRHQLGAVSGLDLSQARTTVESARADAARFAGLAATDRNALELLVGTPVEPAILPRRFDLTLTGVGPLPAGLPSEVLLRRPDVLQAEHALRAANANIGVARAALFPSLSLTGSIGSASAELSGLFGSGTRIWSFVPQLTQPIFEGGRLRANVALATADRDIALARYEQAIRAGFREAADALALSATLAEQRAARAALLEAASLTYQLSQARYDRGRDSFLTVLDAQRTQYASQQSLISAQLSEQANRVTLYQVLGGGWRERSR
jgi:multidrug efflux system outer membrane protein